MGREVALQLAKKGAHVMVADRKAAAAELVEEEAGRLGAADQVSHCGVDLGSSESLAEALEATVLRFGGVDGVIQTAATFPVEGAARVLREQNLPAVLVLTSSANAVVPKRGSEAHEVSKTALNHFIWDLAVRMGPLIRVNGIAFSQEETRQPILPSDCAAAILWLAGEESSQTTGHVIPVDDRFR